MNPTTFYGRNAKDNYPEKLTRNLRNAEDSEDSMLDDSSDEDIPIGNTLDDPDHQYDWSSEDDTPLAHISPAEDENNQADEDDLPLNDVSNQLKMGKGPNKDTVLWKEVKTQTIQPIAPWKGELPLAPDVPYTPMHYFRKFVNGELLEFIVEQSNLFSCQCDPNKPLSMTVEELERFIGITFCMSVYGLPQTRMFWQKECHVTKVTETMSRNRWEQIKSKLHFNNNDLLQDNNNDKLFKLRPFINKLVKNFNNIPMAEKLCVDEQMIPFKGRHCLKQYMKAKPRKLGYKAFVLCGSDGVVYNWELYAGKEELDQTLIDVGVSGNVVMRLAKIIPRNMYHKLYYDN